MPQAIPKGLTRAAVLQAPADLDTGVEHPFGTPTGYEVVHDGRRYAPKAVIGLACRALLGRVRLPVGLSGRAILLATLPPLVLGRWLHWGGGFPARQYAMRSTVSGEGRQERISL
jgi:hypothetical protein